MPHPTPPHKRQHLHVGRAPLFTPHPAHCPQHTAGPPCHTRSPSDHVPKCTAHVTAYSQLPAPEERTPSRRRHPFYTYMNHVAVARTPHAQSCTARASQQPRRARHTQGSAPVTTIQQLAGLPRGAQGRPCTPHAVATEGTCPVALLRPHCTAQPPSPQHISFPAAGSGPVRGRPPLPSAYRQARRTRRHIAVRHADLYHTARQEHNCLATAYGHTRPSAACRATSC